MTINDVITEVGKYEGNIHELAVGPGFRVENGQTLVVGESHYCLKGAGLRRFCEQVSAPAGYMKDLPARIRQPVLQHHLHCCDLSDRPISAIVRGNEFLAFSRPDLYRPSGRDVLEALQAGADRQLEVKQLVISDESFQADLLVENVSEEVAPGDVVSAGVRVTHSLIGEHATWIESFIHRLRCSNGMTHRECVERKELSRTRRMPSERHDAHELQTKQVRQLTADVVGKLRQKLEAIRNLRREQVDVNHLMSRFLERGGMSPRRWLHVLREAWEIEGSEPTAFGVMNAMTRISTHGMKEIEVSARHRRILGRLAGILAFRQLHICPRCFSTLKSPVSNN